MYHNYILKNKFEENDLCYQKIVDLVEVIEEKFGCISTSRIDTSLGNEIESQIWDFTNIELSFEEDSVMECLSILLKVHKEEWYDFVNKQILKILDVYSVEELIELGENEPARLPVVSFGTYFLKPYPEKIKMLIEQNLKSDDELIVRKAVMAAGLSRKELFIPILKEIQTTNKNDIVQNNLEISLGLINRYIKEKSEFIHL